MSKIATMARFWHDKPRLEWHSLSNGTYTRNYPRTQILLLPFMKRPLHFVIFSSHRFRVSAYFLEHNYHILATAVARNCSPYAGFHMLQISICRIFKAYRNLKTVGQISLFIEFVFTKHSNLPNKKSKFDDVRGCFLIIAEILLSCRECQNVHVRCY